MSRSEMSTEVYRDKNTLVEVTIHRKPSENNHSKQEDKNFARPTNSSLSKSKPSPKKLGTASKSQKVKAFNGNKANRDSIRKDSNFQNQRSVKDIVNELKSIVTQSGFTEVQDLLRQLDVPNAEVKDNPTASVSKQKKIKLCEKPDHTGLEAKIQQLDAECQKLKNESSRYRQEYGILVEQMKISKDTVNSLEAQVGDLKKIISRLTRNNGDLLAIVSEKINYEDIIADLEKKKSLLSKQVNEEKIRTSSLETKLHSAEAEAAQLRSIAADLKAGLRHGLAGLDMARPSYKHPPAALGEETRRIIEDVASDTDDSAFYDPNSESLKSRPKSAPVNSNLSMPKSTITVPKVLSQVIPTTAVSQIYRLDAQLPSIPTKASSNGKKKLAQPTTYHESLKPHRDPSSLEPLSLSKEHDISQQSTYHEILRQQHAPHIKDTPSVQPSTQIQSRNSTAIGSLEGNQVFQPLQFDLSETVSESSKVEITKQSLQPSAPLPENLVTESLQSKLNSFLANLQKDSQQLIGLSVPKPIPFEGPSMHLSLSSSNLGPDITGDTTLTEGKFLRGLETSIEVLPAEVSQNSE